MASDTDPADGTLVQREGVDAGSARSTAEGSAPPASAASVLTGGTTTGRPGDAGEPADDDGGPVTQPAQVWADDAGVADPAAAYGTESGQDEGSIE